MDPAARELFLAAAGAVAGLVGTAGGITSLVSYPALLLAGVAPLQANIANLVALVACWPGSAVASQPELRGRGGWLRRWGAVAALGGAAGLGAAARDAARACSPGWSRSSWRPARSPLLLQPWLAAAAARSARRRRGRLLLPCGAVLLSCYNGYFGAGSGVLTLALLLLTTEPRLPTANALKNMVVGAATITSAALFALATRVDWAAVAPLAPGLFAGSLAGPRVARRLPPGLLRWLVALTGLALAVHLWLSRSATGEDGGVEFDYVVVGAGAAGCVVAGRLASGDHRA